MKKILLILTVIAGAFVGGCTKYDNPAPHMEDYDLPPDSIRTRKVLLLIVDGAVGNIVKEVMPTNIEALLPQSKYSFEAVADDHTSTPSSWATLMTGAGTSVHHIEDDSYVAKPSGHNHHGSIAYMPSFIFRLKETRETINVMTFARDLSMSNALMVDANMSEVLESDEEIKNEVVQMLNTRNPDLLLAQFQDVRNAGVSSSFSENSSAYVEAIQRVDGYIGEILHALNSREQVEYEDWLVIVTSNHGGIGSEHGGDSMAERNTFAIYHQPDIVGEELKGEVILAPRFYGYGGTTDVAVRARNETEADGETAYNFNETEELTIEAKIRVNRNAAGDYSYSWPPFLSKTNARTGNTAGWSMFRSGNGVNFFVADGSAKVEITASNVSVDDTWAHITGTIQNAGDEVKARVFVDGRAVVEGQAELNVANMQSTSPLTFGYQPEVFSDAYIDMHMADVRIWNTVLTDDEINENAQRIGVPEDHPKYENLVGYWPMDDMDELLRNRITGMPDIPISGPHSYVLFGNNLPYVDERDVLLQTVDVASQIFYWFGIEPQGSWGFQGQVFLSKFDLEFIK